MVNSASPSGSPYPTPESLPPSPSPAPAANDAGAPQAESSRLKRKQRAPYKVAKRRPMGDLRPTQKPDEHEDVYAHRLWEWTRRGAVHRKGDLKLNWRGRDVCVEDAIRILDDEARKTADQSRALPGGPQGFNGGPSMPLLQPSGPLQTQPTFGAPMPLQQFEPLQAQPFGAPMPFSQPPEPLQARQQFGAQMPLQPLESLPTQPLGAFMAPPTDALQATMPASQTQFATQQPGDFLQGSQDPFPQPALGQQVDYLQGPFMTLEDQQRLGVLDPEPTPAPAPTQQTGYLQGSQDPFSQPALAQQADNLQGTQDPFPQPALAQQVDYNLQGQQPLSVEDQILGGFLSSEPAPAPAQQAEDLPAQDSGDLYTPPTPLPAAMPAPAPAPVGLAPANQSIFDEYSEFIIDPNDSSKDAELGLNFNF